MEKILGFALVSAVLAGVPAARGAAKEGSDVIPVERLIFYQNAQGLTVANGWGDPANGPHSNFIKMPGKAKSGLHTHSASYYGVVINGVLANEPSDGVEARALGPGSYWFQEGKAPHVTNCLSDTECLIFVTSKGSFDFFPVPATASPSASASPPASPHHKQ